MPTIYTVFDYPRRNPNGGNPPWLEAIHAANAAANAAGITEPFGTPELTPMSRVPGETHTHGTCEWYPDHRVEHRRDADYVRITARTAEAANVLLSIAQAHRTTAEDPEDCAYCSGGGSIHCSH